jgi:hypothetical protein
MLVDLLAATWTLFFGLGTGNHSPQRFGDDLVAALSRFVSQLLFLATVSMRGDVIPRPIHFFFSPKPE